MRGLLLLIAIHAGFLNASEITKGNKRAVIIQFDQFEENYVVGDRLIASHNGKKVGLLEITKIKGGKMLARILKGRAEPGMVISKFGDVVGTKVAKDAEPNSEIVTLRFASTFVYRGISFKRPFIGASLDIVNPNVIAGLSVENFDAPATSEFDLYIGRSFNDLIGSITPMIARYFFPGAENMNTWDFSLNITYEIFSIDYSYIPKYYGVESADTYLRGSVLVGLGQKFKAYAHVGYSNFSDEKAVGHKNYYDWKAAVTYATPDFTAEFGWTDTYRVDLAHYQLKDPTAAVVLTKRF